MPRIMAFVERFEIDIISALAEQLVAALEGLKAGALTEANIATLDRERGVYALHHRGKMVYVGKADNLPHRLRDHMEKISGRLRIRLADMAFKCLYVHPNWTALAPEKSLIAYYKESGAGCEWNGIGFGPHDPGRDRETTNKDPDGFDYKYPINEKHRCTWVDARVWNVLELLIALKKGLPFLLRYECENKNYRRGHPDYNSRSVTVPRAGMGARDLLRLIDQAVPHWQGTVFPSHMIFYREARTYTFGQRA